MFTPPFRMVLLALVTTVPGPAWVRAQDPPARDQPGTAPGEKPTAPERPGPPPIKEERLVPDLATVPVRRGTAGFNVHMVDTSLLPRDKEGIWVLDFAFKPIRMRTVELPGKGRRNIYYLYYRVVNRTDRPRMFVPQFSLITDTGKRYEDAVIPQAVELIRAREDLSIPLHNAVDIMGMIPPSRKEGVDDAVFGVAVWEAIDPKADRFSVFVRGLSDGYQLVSAPGGGKPQVRYKALRIDFIRRGDERDLSEKEIQLSDPPYEWIYW
ncbi:MAG: hypothetical protein ACM35G_12695 [Planctomycetaceae bacterium]